MWWYKWFGDVMIFFLKPNVAIFFALSWNMGLDTSMSFLRGIKIYQEDEGSKNQNCLPKGNYLWCKALSTWTKIWSKITKLSQILTRCLHPPPPTNLHFLWPSELTPSNHRPPKSDLLLEDFKFLKQVKISGDEWVLESLQKYVQIPEMARTDLTRWSWLILLWLILIQAVL